MNVMYLTWGETPRSYGVYGSQVIEQFVQTKKKIPGANFIFVSAVPIVHSGFFREKLGYRHELGKVRQKLGDIPLVWIPIYISQNFVKKSRLGFKCMFMGAVNRFKDVVMEFCPDIVHCRSYHAAFIALKVRRDYGFKYKVIFDARGLLPEELALKNSYKENEAPYKFLKSIERLLLEDSDAVIAVSDTMSNHFKELGAKNVETVYLSASSDFLQNEDKNRRQSTLSYKFCYIGALEESSWHRPSSLRKLFDRLKSIYPDSTLTIITTSNHGDLRDIFSSFKAGDVLIKSSKSSSELRELVHGMDFGLMSYFNPSTKLEVLLASMVMAVKTAEYLCAGLPVIINQYCGGAASIIKKYKLGIVYDPFYLEKLSEEDIDLIFESDASANRINEVASALFDYSSHAYQYSILYRKLLTTNES